MKITYIVPGFGGTFYCGNCLRDSAFSNALKAQGHDSVTLPLYLPHSIEDFAHQKEVPVFYGAVNIYLKQNFKLFRKMPKWLYNFFNAPFILKFAAKKSGSTRASGLEEMTISMLKGADGNQNQELEQLIDFLKHHEKPDVVHLSNALLMGVAARIRDEVKVPVFCTLQDEDVWIDAMKPEYQSKLWKLMGEKAKDIDGFIAVSDYFKKLMMTKMEIQEEKISVIPLGVDPKLYKVVSPNLNPPTIGFLSRMCENNGFEILVDAFILLKRKSGFEPIKLVLTGGKTSDNNKFIAQQMKKLEENEMLNDVEIIEDFRPAELHNFFEKISLLSVPVLKGEAFGLFQLEALAAGIPIVQPALGAFPEVVKLSKAGEIYSPNSSEALAEKWEEVLANPEKLNEMSQNGRKAVEEIFNLEITTRTLVGVYEKNLKI